MDLPESLCYVLEQICHLVYTVNMEDCWVQLLLLGPHVTISIPQTQSPGAMSISPYDLKTSTGEGLDTLPVTALELVWGVEPALYLCLCDSTDSGSATIYSSSAGQDCL